MAALTLSVAVFCGSMFAKAQFFDLLQKANAAQEGWWKGAMPVIVFLLEYESGNKLETEPFSNPPGLLLGLASSFVSLLLAAGYMMMTRRTTSAVIAGFIFIQLMIANDIESKLPVHVEQGAIKIRVGNPEQADAFFQLLGTSHSMESTALVMCTAMCVYACMEQQLSVSKAAVVAALGFNSGLLARATGVDAAILNSFSSAEVRRFASASYGTTVNVVHDGDLARVPLLAAASTFVLATVVARGVSLFFFRTAMSTFSTACVGVGMAFGAMYVEPNLRQLAVASGSDLESGRGAALVLPVAEGHLGELCAWSLAALFAAGDLLTSFPTRKLKMN